MVYPMVVLVDIRLEGVTLRQHRHLPAVDILGGTMGLSIGGFGSSSAAHGRGRGRSKGRGGY